MAALSVSAVRQRVAAAVEAISGWTESRHAWASFGRDTDSLVHHSFSIGTPTTDVLPEQRQRRSEGALVETVVEVSWAHRLRGDAQVSDTDAALAAEAGLITTLMGVSQADCHIVLEGAEREVEGDGTWLVGTVTVRAVHRLALT